MGTHKHIHCDSAFNKFLSKLPVVVVSRYKNGLFLVSVKVFRVISCYMGSRAFVV